MEDQLIQSAIETQTPGVTIPAHSTLTLRVTQAIIEQFNAENRIVVRVTFNTPASSPTAALYKDYFLDFKVVANGEVIMSYE